eukprot:m.285030 g.285030  ORF g.285030 m.285030 type:complete len:592 (+) comp19430_c3_seq2:78-1853(+)
MTCLARLFPVVVAVACILRQSGVTGNTPAPTGVDAQVGEVAGFEARMATFVAQRALLQEWQEYDMALASYTQRALEGCECLCSRTDANGQRLEYAECDPTRMATGEQVLERASVCRPYTTCNATSEYELAPGTATSDRICARVTSCAQGWFQSVPPTSVTDAECSPCMSCMGHVVSPCSKTSDTVCLVLNCTATERPALSEGQCVDCGCDAHATCNEVNDGPGDAPGQAVAVCAQDDTDFYQALGLAGTHTCHCQQSYAGDGMFCGPDTDQDGFPDDELACSDLCPMCQQDRCPDDPAVHFVNDEDFRLGKSYAFPSSQADVQSVIVEAGWRVQRGDFGAAVQHTGGLSPTAFVLSPTFTVVQFETIITVNSDSTDGCIGVVFGVQSEGQLFTALWKNTGDNRGSLAVHRVTSGIEDFDVLAKATPLPPLPEGVSLVLDTPHASAWQSRMPYRLTLWLDATLGVFRLKVNVMQGASAQTVLDTGGVSVEDPAALVGQIGPLTYQQENARWQGFDYACAVEPSVFEATAMLGEAVEGLEPTHSMASTSTVVTSSTSTGTTEGPAMGSDDSADNSNPIVPTETVVATTTTDPL